ncbi:DUF5979 domain-containing protein [Microbacterium arborescens]|uniref:DUF5979 domain-containing protein n=1 Tax=Microbacterium arborescens TaxID=33883 RepID=UPI00308443E2
MEHPIPYRETPEDRIHLLPPRTGTAGPGSSSVGPDRGLGGRRPDKSPFAIAAGSGAGDDEQVYSDLPAGSECVVTETQCGTTALVQVATADPVTVEILPATGGGEPYLGLMFGLGSMMVGLLVRGRNRCRSFTRMDDET